MIISHTELGELRAELAAEGRPVVFTPGTYDGRHPGQDQFLEWVEWQAGDLGALVVVMTRPDDRVFASKGRTPIFSEGERAYMVHRTRGVDFSFVGKANQDGKKTSVTAARLLRPAYVAIGDGWVGECSIWARALPNARLLRAPFPHVDSTTSVIERVRRRYISQKDE